jgi:WD40 repeat protein
MLPALLPALLTLISLLACAGDDPSPLAAQPGELIFVRGGLIAPGGAGRAVPGGVLLERPWSPGEAVEAGGGAGVGPLMAECLPLYSSDLGDVSRLVAMGEGAPNTALAFSPDGGRLAVGSYLGEVRVLDGWTGATLASERLAETMVKFVAWSPDGATLYAAEQSPDAYVHAFDPATLERRWSLRLADLVESSPAPDAEDIFGVYTLPAAYGLEVLPGGDLVVVALHSWTDGEGVHRNRSQVLRVSAAGEVTARWPAAPADATLKHPAVDAAGGLVAVSVDRTADGADPGGLPLGGVQVLDLETLAPVVDFVPEALEPWFKRAGVWEALDLSRADDAVFVGLRDGRAQVWGLDGRLRLSRDSGAPVMAGDVPIHAGTGWGFLREGAAIYVNTGTYIPWGAASPELRPPTAHPGENTLWGLAPDGEVRWSWTGDQRLQGLSTSPDGRTLVAGAGARESDSRRDLFGALVFDLAAGDPERASGAERLQAFCPTEGPVFFRHAVTDDGRVAVAEIPFAGDDGAVSGAYRVTVFR